ncbi:MAG: hypothetical protein WC757_04000 [Candidatus Paceibacterota bacterium]|jgi:hypothetical protein
MKNRINREQGGFIQALIIIIIALVILKVLGYDVREIIASPKVQHLWQIALSFIQDGWNLLLDAIDKTVVIAKPFWDRL